MTRVSDSSYSQILIGQLNQANAREFRTQVQISTGKEAQYFKELTNETGVLLSAKRQLVRTEAFAQTTDELKGRIDVQDLNLKEMETFAADLRQTLIEAVAGDTGTTLMEDIDGIFRQLVNILNTNVNSEYIYGGTRRDVRPVNIDSLDDLALAPTVASIFENNDIRASAAIDEGVVIEHGFLADELGTDIMTILRDIKIFNDGVNGPFADKLTDAQRTFIEGRIAPAKAAATKATNFTAKNGVHQNEVEAVERRHEDAKVLTTQFITDIEDADLAAAITQLNQDQIAVQASAKMVAELGRLSLLDFI